ncbi:hypothetical protein AMK13_15210 [Streptomyces sp. CB02056]|nr:hypothetical protein AMK13_15210 [Streptomyces sp. CB02056]
MKFEDQDPNFFESDAHAVPCPHHAVSRAAKVEFTSLVTAARRLSTVMKCRSAASLSPCSPVATIARMPMFVPSAKRASRRRRWRTSRSMRSYAATEENSSVKPVRKSALFSTSSTSRTPQRRASSSLRAARPVGSASGSRPATHDLLRGWCLS